MVCMSRKGYRGEGKKKYRLSMPSRTRTSYDFPWRGPCRTSTNVGVSDRFPARPDRAPTGTRCCLVPLETDTDLAIPTSTPSREMSERLSPRLCGLDFVRGRVVGLVSSGAIIRSTFSFDGLSEAVSGGQIGQSLGGVIGVTSSGVV